jgi:hypothetical protein
MNYRDLYKRGCQYFGPEIKIKWKPLPKPGVSFGTQTTATSCGHPKSKQGICCSDCPTCAESVDGQPGNSACQQCREEDER